MPMPPQIEMTTATYLKTRVVRRFSRATERHYSSLTEPPRGRWRE